MSTYIVDGVEYDMSDKPSNPKDIIGSNKLPLGLVPGTTKAYLALGHLEGNLKYGLVNWREAGVRMSIYLDALERHATKLAGGEWADPLTKSPHLANILACASIIVDAYHSGKLTDDRALPTDGVHDPLPSGRMSVAQLIDSFGVNVIHLKDLFGDKKPIDYFIDGGKQRE